MEGLKLTDITDPGERRLPGPVRKPILQLAQMVTNRLLYRTRRGLLQYDPARARRPAQHAAGGGQPHGRTRRGAARRDRGERTAAGAEGAA